MGLLLLYHEQSRPPKRLTGRTQEGGMCFAIPPSRSGSRRHAKGADEVLAEEIRRLGDVIRKSRQEISWKILPRGAELKWEEYDRLRNKLWKWE